jgi:hypothetical protein
MRPELKPRYRVIKTEECLQQLNELSKLYGRATELIDGIEWALARNPHRFTQLAHDFYFWITDELTNIKFPTVKVVYKINQEESTVIILSIEER